MEKVILISSISNVKQTKTTLPAMSLFIILLGLLFWVSLGHFCSFLSSHTGQTQMPLCQ